MIYTNRIYNSYAACVSRYAENFEEIEQNELEKIIQGEKKKKKKIKRKKIYRSVYRKRRKQILIKLNNRCTNCLQQSRQYYKTSQCSCKLCFICASHKFTKDYRDIFCDCNKYCMYSPRYINNFFKNNNFIKWKIQYTMFTPSPKSNTKQAIKRRKKRQENRIQKQNDPCPICMDPTGSLLKISETEDYKCTEMICLSGCNHKICESCMFTRLIERTPLNQRSYRYVDHIKIIHTNFSCCICRSPILKSVGLKFIRDNLFDESTALYKINNNECFNDEISKQLLERRRRLCKKVAKTFIDDKIQQFYNKFINI